MLGLRVTVPIACWRKGHAREYWESEPLPPPSQCYGALLSLVGETDRERHRGCRVSAGLLRDSEDSAAPRRMEGSVVLRTFWQIKEEKVPQGQGVNAGPDYQQLLSDADLIVFCDSSEEPTGALSLEARVRQALADPASVSRFGGWSLGESTHLINDVWLLPTGCPPRACDTFMLMSAGSLTLPVWVDHVGSAHTRYATGGLQRLTAPPEPSSLPQIPIK